MWKIEIIPSKSAGDGEIRIADTPEGVRPFAQVIEDYRLVSFHADNRDELIKGIINYGLVTGKITPEQIQEFLDTPIPAGSKNWSLEQWEAYKATLDTAIEERQRQMPTVAELMSGLDSRKN